MKEERYSSTYNAMIRRYIHLLKKRRDGVSEAFHKQLCQLKAEQEYGMKIQDKDL